MKNLVLIILMIVPLAVSAQHEISKEQTWRRENYSRGIARFYGNNWSTAFSNMRLNFANSRFQTFMHENEFRLDSESASDSLITLVYSKSVQINNEAGKSVEVTYNVYPIENDFYIKSMEINGYLPYLIDIYVGLWNTKLNFEDVKDDEVVINHFEEDRISLKWSDQEATILVSKN